MNMDKKRVLIVDDDREFLEELKEAFSLSGYDVAAVSDPILGLSVAIQVRPQVIVLDLKMPNMSGFQFADEIRHLCEVENVPIIAMSAYFKDEYEPLLHLCGIRECLKKPFDPEYMTKRIDKALEEKR